MHACVCIHMGVRFLCATSVWVGAIVCHQGSARLDPTTDGSRLGGSVGRARRNLGVMEHTHIRHEFSHFRLESWFRHACVNKSADTACTWSNFEGCVRYGPPVQAQLPCGRCDFKAAHTAASPAARSPIARAQARHSASPRAQIHSRHRARPCPAASTASPSPSLTAPLSPLAALQLIPSFFSFRRSSMPGLGWPS